MLAYLTGCTQVGQSWLHRSVVSQQCTTATSEAGALVIPPLQRVSLSLLWAQPVWPPKYSILALGSKGAPVQVSTPHTPCCFQTQRPVGTMKCFALEGNPVFLAYHFYILFGKQAPFMERILWSYGMMGLAKLGFVLRPAVLTTTTSFLGFFFSTERKMHIVTRIFWWWL